MTRKHWPATARNREPIAAVLDEVLPSTGVVLELASGSGEHGVFFAERWPRLTWQPSDIDPENLASVRAWREHAALPNLREPLVIDVTADGWPIERADAVFNANMIHIAPWPATLGLLDGVARVLRPGAPLVMYGPYMRGGEHTAPSNARFDESLRSRDPSWGVRDLDVVVAEANQRGLGLERVVEMPANNLTVIYRRQ